MVGYVGFKIFVKKVVVGMINFPSKERLNFHSVTAFKIAEYQTRIKEVQPLVAYPPENMVHFQRQYLQNRDKIPWI